LHDESYLAAPSPNQLRLDGLITLVTSMPNIVMLATGLVVPICAVLVVLRALTQFSPKRVREDLTVSRGWLLEHQARKGDY
jgi:hypothetical protein